MSLKSWLRQQLSDNTPSRITTDAPLPVVSKLPEPQNIPEMPPIVAPKKPRKSRAKKVVPPVVVPVVPTENPEKLAATAKGEPWVSVTGIDLDLDSLGSGSFSLDWNDIFVAKLIRAGYAGKTDIDVVDLWFADICRNVLAENFEQYNADPTNRG